MQEYTVISRQILIGTISDLPLSARMAWIAILFESEKLRGLVKLPVRALAKMASITTAEAAEALRLFQEPDSLSSSRAAEGRRLIAVDGQEDWYHVVTWEKHAEEREAFFTKLRVQRHRAAKKRESKRPQRKTE
jgi:DNA repair protein RadC